MKRVTGFGIDGTTVSVTMGRTVIPCTKGSYGDSLDPAKLSYMGGQQQDEKTRGTYKTDDAKFTMSAVIFRTVFMPGMPATGAGNMQFPIIVNREHPELGDDSDMILGCSVMNLGAAIEQSSKAEEVEVTFSTLQVQWTDRRVCINSIAGTAATEGTL